MKSSPTRRRVVVSGFGAITPLGLDSTSSFQALCEGQSGVRFMPEWDFMEDLQCRLGATVEGVDLKARYHRRVRRTMGRVALLALSATEEAVQKAGLSETQLSSGRIGAAYGSTSGSSSELETFSRPLINSNTMRGLESNAYLRVMAHTCAANLASHFKIRGRVQPTCSACTSASQAIGVGTEAIRAGVADVMICGGAEEMHYTTAVTFDLLMATSVRFNQQPAESPRPFDRKRDGLVVGEGAATVVLEDLEHARQRGAPILGEVLGFAGNCDGAHLTQPSVDGMRNVMKLAIEDAGLTPNDIDYVNAHATGTPIGDTCEARATLDVFGRAVPISSQKGYVGHTLGACGSLEVIWSLQMMEKGVLLPNRNLTEVDPECSGLDYLTEPRNQPVSHVLSNNFAFGGMNTSIVLGPPPTE